VETPATATIRDHRLGTGFDIRWHAPVSELHNPTKPNSGLSLPLNVRISADDAGRSGAAGQGGFWPGAGSERETLVAQSCLSRCCRPSPPHQGMSRKRTPVPMPSIAGAPGMFPARTFPVLSICHGFALGLLHKLDIQIAGPARQKQSSWARTDPMSVLALAGDIGWDPDARSLTTRTPQARRWGSCSERIHTPR
jgi:hypothetical protein